MKVRTHHEFELTSAKPGFESRCFGFLAMNMFYVLMLFVNPIWTCFIEIKYCLWTLKWKIDDSFLYLERVKLNKDGSEDQNAD